MIRLFTICLVCIGAFASGQQPYFQKLETVDGIASDKVYSVLQDRSGYLWFGTDAGVSMFDGFSFRNFDNRKDLTANEVFEIFEDSKGRLWFLSQNGEVSFYFNNELHTSKNVSAFKELKLKSDLTSIWELQNGKIAISSFAHGVAVLDTNLKATYYDIASVFQVWENERDELLSLGLEGIYWLKVDGTSELVEPFKREGQYARTCVFNDTCYIGVGDQLYRYFDKMEFVTQLPNGEKITFLDKHADGLAIGTRTGFYRNYNVQRTAIGNERLFDGSVISASVTDNEGNLWVTTVGDGVYFSSSPDVNIYTTESGLALNQVSVLHKKPNGDVWIGYRNGSYGVKRGDKIFNEQTPTPTNEPVTQIKTNRNNETLVLSKSYATFIDSNNQKKYLRILLNDVFIDSNVVYLGSNRTYKVQASTFYKSMSFDKDNLGLIDQDVLLNPLVSHRTKVINKDSHGNLFLGTDRGLYVENEGITIQLGANIPALNAYINDIVFDQKRELTYVATRGEGVVVLRGTSELQRFTLSNNLSSNTCVALELDEFGQLWIGTNQGLDLIRNILIDTSVVRFGAHIGMRPTTVFDIVRKDDVLHLATNLGMMTFDVNTPIGQITPAKPKILGVYVTSKFMELVEGNNTIKYDHNTIRFDFTTVSFKHMSHVTYAYKLEGYQESWRVTNDRNIQFDRLKPGDYKFNLKAVHMTGMESEPIQISFTILKPFWKLWYVQLLALLLLIVTTYYIVSSRLKDWREKMTLENRLSEIKIDKLQLEKAYLLAEQKAGVMQMNPHFLFNSLNTIKGYYGQGKMKEANGFIGKFSKLLRKILESNKPLIPLQDEAEILTLYLELMRNRYDQVFEYEIINLVEEQHNLKIPPMILQPIVENAVIHGLAPIGAGKITVTFEIFEDYLVCKVVDSGVGFSEEVQDQHHSVALENIRDRLEILSKQYGKTCSIKILSPVNGSKNPGTAVIIKLPLNT